MVVVGGALLTLAGCSGVSLPFGGNGDQPQPGVSAGPGGAVGTVAQNQTAGAPAPQGEEAAAGQPTTPPGAGVQAFGTGAEHPPAPAQTAVAEGPSPSAGATVQLQGAAQPPSAPPEATDEPPSGGPERVEVGRPTLGAGLRRRLDNMLGGGSAVSSGVGENQIRERDVVGTWTVEEEDGLRTCSVNLAVADDANRAAVTPGCSEVMVAVSTWGLFGDDLLLRDAENSVLVRLRRSDASWVGFTLASGIPVVLSR